MFCPKCGTANDATGKFCQKCGQQLASGTSSPQNTVPDERLRGSGQFIASDDKRYASGKTRLLR